MLTWFSPCPWGDADGYTATRNFYHGTAVGRAITNSFWSILGGDVIALNKYDKHPETAKLKPWSHPMFTASSFSILNYPTDFFDLVRNGTISVHVADITHLSPNTVHLSNNTTITDTDALLCCTGWKHVPPVKFLPEGLEADLGLPHTPLGASEPLLTDSALAAADATLLATFPRLRDQPVVNAKLKPLLATPGLTTTDAINPSTPLTPYALYHFIAPPSARFLRTRDVAFAGYLMNFTTTMIAHAQSVWITAFFDDQLPATTMPLARTLRGGGSGEFGAKTLAQVHEETVLHARYGKWRYGAAGHGGQFPDFVFDAVPYVDLLMRDLGLRVYRKGGWLAEATEPYGPEEYKDLVAEWAGKSREG